MPALPMPMRAEGRRNIQTGVSGRMSAAYQTSDPATSRRPGTSMRRGSMRSSRRPASGDSTPAATAMGTISSADSVGVRPRASWMKNMSGSAWPVTTKPTIAMPKFDREKLRSRKRLSGSSGSLFVTACCQTKRPSSTRPTTIRLHTEIGPQITPQS